MRYSLHVCRSYEPLEQSVDLTHMHAQTARQQNTILPPNKQHPVQ